MQFWWKWFHWVFSRWKTSLCERRTAAVSLLTPASSRKSCECPAASSAVFASLSAPLSSSASSLLHPKWHDSSRSSACLSHSSRTTVAQKSLTSSNLGPRRIWTPCKVINHEDKGTHVELPLQIFKDLKDLQDFQRSSRIFANLKDLQETQSTSWRYLKNIVWK